MKNSHLLTVRLSAQMGLSELAALCVPRWTSVRLTASQARLKHKKTTLLKSPLTPLPEAVRSLPTASTAVISIPWIAPSPPIHRWMSRLGGLFNRPTVWVRDGGSGIFLRRERTKTSNHQSVITEIPGRTWRNQWFEVKSSVVSTSVPTVVPTFSCQCAKCSLFWPALLNVMELERRACRRTSTASHELVCHSLYFFHMCVIP